MANQQKLLLLFVVLLIAIGESIIGQLEQKRFIKFPTFFITTLNKTNF